MLKKLKDLFVVSDETLQKEAAKAPVKETENKNPGKEKSPDVELPNTNLSGPADPKFIDILLNAIERNNMDGFDYLEFKQSLQNLNAIGMDDAMRYNSAIAMAKTMGADDKSIVASANHYLKVLKTEEEKFQQALAGQKQKLDEDKNAGLNHLQNEIAAKKKQIELLKQQIEEAEAELVSAEKKIADSNRKIGETHANFTRAYRVVVQQIMDDVEKIGRYIKS